MEPRIRELRADYALRKIPTHGFAANALYLEILRLAYNLVTAFQRTCLPEGWQTLTLSKLRHRLFWLPGELTRPQNRPVLRIPGRPAIQEWTAHILHGPTAGRAEMAARESISSIPAIEAHNGPTIARAMPDQVDDVHRARVCAEGQSCHRLAEFPIGRSCAVGCRCPVPGGILNNSYG